MIGDIKTTDIISVQIPEVFQEEGPVLVAFIKAYYDWLDSSIYGNDIELLELRDIDETIDEFLQYFKETYLPNLPNLSPERIKLFVKNINSFYNSRGSEASFNLLFKILYSLEAKVYNPSSDILIASDGKWNKPIYIETTINENAEQFINKTITGSQSGTTAIVESVVKKNMNGAFYSVIYISKSTGNFIAGERITYDGNILNALVVLGSLNEIDIIEGGRDNKVGDIFEVQSDIGKYAKVRVTDTENETGRVNFKLEEGGTGYSLNAKAIISQRNFTLANTFGTFEILEGVHQISSNVAFLSANGTFTVGDIIEARTSGTNIFQGQGTIVNVIQNNANGIFKVVHANSYTDFALASTINKVGNTISALIDTVSTTTATANVVGVESNVVGIYNTNNVFYTGFSVTGDRTNSSGIIVEQSTGQGANFGIGSIAGEETVWINTDLLSNLNTQGSVFLNIGLNGSGSGIGNVSSVTVNSGGSGYVNSNSLIFTGGGQRVQSILIANSGIGYANGERLIITSNTGKFATGSVTTNSNGSIVSTTISNTGIGYITTPIITVNTASGTGANLISVSAPTINATATLSTNTTGGITSITVTDSGFGYFSAPIISAPTGSGANLTPLMVYGYGFPKNPNGNINTIIDRCLSSNTVEIGIISSLTRISPGSGYNETPFVLVIEPYTATLNKHDLIVSVTDLVGVFFPGELLNQNRTIPANLITYTLTSGSGFEVGELVTQGARSGIVYQTDSSSIRLNQVVNGPFIIGSAITGQGSGTIANPTATTPISYSSVAKGVVKSYSNNTLVVSRLSFNTSYSPSYGIIGLSSGATANVVSVVEDTTSKVMGNNALVSATVNTANGIATKLEIIDSGFGYPDDYQVTLVSEDNPFVIRGLTEVNYQGEAEGYWLNTDGFLSSDKYLHDGNYYQAYSYEVQVGLSLDRYADIIKKLLHTAGTKMFGRYILITSNSVDITTDTTIITNT